jgi:hypothetical protein
MAARANHRQQDILYEHYAWKKSPTGIPGFRRWQKRYLIIDRKAITYYKTEKEKVPQGVIPLLEISTALVSSQALHLFVRRHRTHSPHLSRSGVHAE